MLLTGECRVASLAYLIDTASLSHNKILLLTLRFCTDETMLLKFVFITINYSNMSENRCYVIWLIGVETERLLGDQRHR